MGKLKLVVTERANGKKYYITNEEKWNSKDIIGRFLNRWSIEVMHKDKGEWVKAHIPKKWQEGGDGPLPICHRKNSSRNFHNHL